MDVMYTYIHVLKDTLQKKRDVMRQIYEATVQQKQLLQSGKFKEDEFQKTLDLKEQLLSELEQLDVGFEKIYERVAVAIKYNKELYKEEIQKAQQHIQEIMDLSVSIHAMEEQNKLRFSVCMTERRKHLGTIRTNSRMVNNYYKSMPNVHKAGNTYFLDEKK